MKTKWLNNIKNGTGQDHPSWRGNPYPPQPPTPAKIALVAWCKANGLLGQDRPGRK